MTSPPGDRRVARGHWPKLSRRVVLAGAGLGVAGAGGLAVAGEVVPGRAWIRRQLGSGGPDGVVPAVAGGRVVRGSFGSRARGGRRCGWAIAYPPGQRGSTEGLPVVVVLHGRRNSHASVFDPDYLGLDRFLAAGVEQGLRPFALASVDGGDSYWHRRRNGEDAGAMVVEEFLPFLASRGLDVGRVGLMGWSMGGYGALRLAGLLGPGRVAGVGAMSPALWHAYADTSPGSFDDEADFRAMTVVGRQRDLTDVPVRVDCGQADPFYDVARENAGGFAEAPAGSFGPGGHDVGYWRAMAPAQLRFLGRSFSG